MTTSLQGPLARYVDAVNAGDLEAIVALFADDAVINDARREIRGRDAIRAFVTTEVVGDHLSLDVTEVIELDGITIVRAIYDGTYDKSGVPDPLILTNYFALHEDGITAQITILNQSSPG